ncbi:MAG: cysteine desulfurase [Asticcacaulis sp. 32-58-5]|nr:MAG: cysteine desulfurase [Asticcacaulis sp. 32-58-5]
MSNTASIVPRPAINVPGKGGNGSPSPIYLDGFSTTPLAPEAAEAMIDAWSLPGNANSPHVLGARASGILENARIEIANLIGANPSEVIFTSGATEANNLAILGCARAAKAAKSARNRIVVSAIEHKSVLEPAAWLEAEGYEVVRVSATPYGVIDLEALASAVNEQTLLVSVMAINNETGVVQPIERIAALARGAGAFFHCDAAQAVGKWPIDVFELDVDYLSISAHKMYGPMGVGALYVASGAMRPEAIIAGGGQQSGLRPGTQPIPLISGFGAAAGLAASVLNTKEGGAGMLSQRFLAELKAAGLPFHVVTGDEIVVPGSACISIDGVAADELVDILQSKVCISTGSACTQGQVLPSHVLMGMGLSHVKANEVFRVMFGRYNSDLDVVKVSASIVESANLLRGATGQVRQ